MKSVEDWFEDVFYDELRQQERADNLYQNDLRYHPDCRDPNHPGCRKCEPEHFDDVEDRDDDQSASSHREQ
ncbi:hypothetical protein [Endozoicomonas sp. ALB091]|uniref:hypothetical protein n=1 Tax=Endozoicomonas sp. ALB091 TaxID=3403073 RepID=UPI003BB5BC73